MTAVPIRLASILVLLACIEGCASSSGDDEDNAIVIGSLFDESASVERQQMFHSMQMAVEEINAAGIFQRPVKLVNRDPVSGDTIDDEKAVRYAKELFDVHKAVGLVTIDSSMIQALIDLSTLDPAYSHLVQCSGEATGPLLNLEDMGGDQNDNLFRTVVSDSYYVKVGKSMVHDNSWFHVGMYHSDDSFGSGVAALVAIAMAELGSDYEITLKRTIPLGDFNVEANQANMDEFIDFTKNGILDAIMLMAEKAPVFSVLKYFTEHGLQGPVWIPAGALHDDLFQIATGIPSWLPQYPRNRIFGLESYSFGGKNSQAFQTAYTTRFGQVERIPSSTNYDCIYAFALAMLYAGVDDPDPAALKAGLGHFKTSQRTTDEVEVGIGSAELARAKEIIDGGGRVNYEGASGRLEFTEQGERPRMSAQMIGVDPTGTKWEFQGAYDEDLNLVP